MNVTSEFSAGMGYYSLQGLKKCLVNSKDYMLSIVNEQMLSKSIKGSLLEEIMSIEALNEEYVYL